MKLTAAVFIAIFSAAFALEKCPDGQTVIGSGIPPAEQQKIVDKHNEIRNNVASGRLEGQGPAQNMRELVWDDELAQKAQNWAENCVFLHDPEIGDLGQNLAGAGDSSTDFADTAAMINDWYSEFTEFGYTNEPYNDSMDDTGHYSELIWAKNNKIGCGYVAFKEDLNTKILVCNYYPGGNLEGTKAYEDGPRDCKKYGLKNSSKFDNLCS